MASAAPRPVPTVARLGPHGDHGATSDRLLDAATELFARRGFHATSIRDIAERAGANVAAGHYHYGSKKGLYLQVLRQQFANVRSIVDRHGPLPPTRVLCRLPRRELIALLTRRVETMIEVMIAPPLQPHGALMLREMCDPTDAMPIIVHEFIRPQMAEMAAIVAALIPGAPAATVQRCVRSIVGQVLFYRFAMPVMLLMLAKPSYPQRFTREMAAHVVEFSLGGLARVARGRSRAPAPRARVRRVRAPNRRSLRGR
jgi:AcrR family transcriptional regulator